MAYRESKTSARRLKARDRALQALELRRAGLTYQEIADHPEVGYSSRRKAQEAVQRILREVAEEPAHDVRKFELGRLERLLRAHWSDALYERTCRRCGGSGELPIKGGFRQCQACQGAGTTDRKLRATTTVLSILDRIHRLKGLDEGVPIGEEGEILLTVRRETSWRVASDGSPAEAKQVAEASMRQLARRTRGGSNGNGDADAATQGP